VEQGAVKINEDKVEDINARVTKEHFASGALLLRAGKKKVHRFVLG
jgi:tyrosyl-tRNA synthetase